MSDFWFFFLIFGLGVPGFIIIVWKSCFWLGEKWLGGNKE